MSDYNVYEWGGISLHPEEKSHIDPFSQGFTHEDLIKPNHGPFDGTVVREPVIYIDNLETEDIELQVDIMPYGDITESIPTYNKIGDWKVKVSPEGYINDIIPYLYYEVNIDLKECLDDGNSFIVNYDLQKDKVWGFLKTYFEELGFREKHFTDFVAYWYKFIMNFDGNINISLFREDMIKKYFHTIFSPSAPIHWKRFYCIFWQNKDFEL